VQFELYLWELDGDFNSIHVRMMHDAYEGFLVTSDSLYQNGTLRQRCAMKQAAARCHIAISPSRQQIPDFATYRNRLLAAALLK
jgi:hypothetical protein